MLAAISLSTVSLANKGGVPIWRANPEVRGKAEVDRKLSVRIPAGSYVYTPTLDFARPLISWQWKRDGVAIDGAIEAVYVTTNADLGKAITCTVTLTGENASAPATSGSTISYVDKVYATDTTTTVTTSNVIQASTITTTLDLTTVGMKAASTTGSMTAGSFTLTVADASNFAIGNPIIVATGGEAGGGTWGTKGVGGTVPSLSYANATAMNADASQSTGRLCWVETDGYVRQWNGSAWVNLYDYNNDDFYAVRALPYALRATITNKVGNTLTLSAAAVVQTTNANVYYDNTNVAINYLKGTQTSTLITNKKMTLPVGTFAFSFGQDATWLKDCVVEGAGKTSTIFFAPDGCGPAYWQMSQCQRVIFRNIGIRGNHKLNSWGQVLSSNAAYTTYYPTAVLSTLCDDNLIDNVNIENTLTSACGTSFSADCYYRDVSFTSTAPERRYISWAIGVAESSYCGIINCSADSAYMLHALESFRSDYTVIRGFNGRNTAVAINTVGGFYVENVTITLNANSHYQYDAAKAQQNWGPYDPIVNVNTNIANQSGGDGIDLAASGGSIVNLQFVQEGFLEASIAERNNVIVVAPAYQSVMIKGGKIQVPVRTTGLGCRGASCDGDGMTVAGVRFIGFSAAGDYAAIATDDQHGHGRVVGCIGENFLARVSRRNRTNAEYIAAGGV